jgi:hypothetical protein
MICNFAPSMIYWIAAFGGKKKGIHSMRRDGCAVGVIILILFIAFLLLALSPDQPSSPPAPTSSPTPTPEPLEGTPASTTTASGSCQKGIAVDKSVDVVYTGVRVRQSAGYVNKNDAQDTIHYLKTGDKAKVKAGPKKKDGLCWWKLEHDGVEGWTADHSRTGRLLLKAGQ